VDGVLYIGSGDGGVYAFGASTGVQRWRYSAGAPVTSTPAVSGGLVVFSASDGTIQAIDAIRGTRRWVVHSGPEAALPWGHESGDTWTSSPTIAGKLVLVGSGDGFLYALDLATGAVRWKGATGRRIRSSPAVSGTLAVVGSGDGRVYAFDLASGRERWRFATQGVEFNSDTFGYDRKTVQSSPAIAGDLVVVGARDGFLYGLELSTGRQRWVVDHHISWVSCSVAIADGTVYTGTSDGQFVQAVDAASGRELWKKEHVGLVWASPAVAGEVLYVATTRGPIVAYDRATGAERWRVSLPAGSFSSPVIAGNRLFLGTDDGRVYALDLTAPAPLERFVFWDSSYARVTFLPDHIALRDYLTRRGYSVTDAAGVRAALAPDQASHRVIVFAMDYLVPEQAELVRGFLQAGGKIVWPGTPPLLWPRELATGDLSLLGLDRQGPARLLGVQHERGNFDNVGTHAITPEGKRWGLDGWWMSSWSADPASVSVVLALDEQGLASAWLRGFEGRPGSGFVRLPGTAQPATILRVAEYFPAQPRGPAKG
jgi:outer membrane protein assembly factor BamB